jgi:hypothetical protein
MNARAPHSHAAIAKRVAMGYGHLECLQCAEALYRAFKEEGHTAVILQLQAISTKPYISMRRKNFKLPFDVKNGHRSISENGFHYGVCVGEFVFDNIFQKGVALDSWPGQFVCDGNLECSEYQPS